ncbi:hypothetical protein HN51_028651 [Arachis hypogaea]|uniref:Protein SIEVE ELEMENT OCCLUSION B n=1 Tax=Arachis hypogaea TaxID=3818 RepID=A0A445BHX2_ARAHY|nr:hypothetical protein Ahy_A09g043279 isoform B [Arachis hypogaea]
MAMSNADSSGTTTLISSSQGGSTAITSIQQQSATTNMGGQQKIHLPNPFDLTDSQILDRVYLTHVNDDEICNTSILFGLVSNLILQGSYSTISTVSFKPEFPTLKLVSCQMIGTKHGPQCVHQTALWILQHLRCYSWDAKALITLAAFSLEYGNFILLSRTPTQDIVGSSLRQLNQIQERKVSSEITELLSFIVKAFHHIKVWATWSSEGYDPEEVPTLTEALQEVPLVVYWTIASIVASTGNLLAFTEYSLSEFRERLAAVVKKLADHLEICKLEIGYIDDYLSRRRIFEKPKDIVDLLKALILPNNGAQVPQIYQGSIQIKQVNLIISFANNFNKELLNIIKYIQGLEVFKEKHVLLFISSLYSIGDEIMLLNCLHDRLQESPKEWKGFKKEDFKILWIPIVEWDEAKREQFKTWKNSIKWYAVECYSELPGGRIISEPEGLNYMGKPILPVYNPQGYKANEDAMGLIFQWGIDAFPFRKTDAADLILKWKWLWDIIRKVAPGLQVQGDRYLFIFGGSNKKWIQDFTLEVEKVKRHESVKRADVIIDKYELGSSVPSFWIGIERMRQNKKHQEAVDCEIQGIAKSLFCLKRDPEGWAILTKGQNIKLLGHGEAMYRTLAEFQSWKDKVFEKEGFDIAFKEYYDVKVKEIADRQPCSIVNVDSSNYGSSVIATITCPNPTCGRVMEVTSVNYKCCHRDNNDSNYCGY